MARRESGRREEGERGAKMVRREAKRKKDGEKQRKDKSYKKGKKRLRGGRR